LVVLMAVSMVTPRAGGLIIVERWWPGPGRPPEIWPPIPPPRPIPPPDWHPPHWRPFPLAPLEVASERIDAKVKDQVATVSIEQEFYNPNSQQLEGTFLFPIPKGAQLDKFKMEIGGKMMEPELLSAEKARKIYEEIVRAAKDPALLEYEGRDLLKVRIFPIEGHSRKKIALSYTQVLKQDAGLMEMVLPLSAQKFSAKPVEKLSLHLELETTSALKTVYSPTHAVDVERAGSQRAVVKLDEKQLAGEKDFHLSYGFEKSEVALNVLTHRGAEGDGYFLLFASPGIDATEKAVVAKDVAFVLDTSGSMSGAKIEQARKALLFCVRNLNDGDRFEVTRFSTETES
jgi:Ca-activated chloride channel homolog